MSLCFSETGNRETQFLDSL